MRTIMTSLAALVLATPAAAQVSNPPIVAPIDMVAVEAEISTATKAANDAMTMAQAAAARSIPQPSTSAPPGVADAGTTGTTTNVYALANHTHASKARKDRILIPVTNGTVVSNVTFTTPFTNAVPICAVVAETTLGDTNVVNAQIDGTPTMTGMRIRITRTAITLASVLGLNILSVPTQVATWAHYVCLEP